MFSGKSTFNDFSYDVLDAQEWNVSTVRRVQCITDIATMAIEPLSGLLAVGNLKGNIHVFGAGAVTTMLSQPKRSAVKALQFSSRFHKLISIDQRGYMHIWDMDTFGQPKLEKTELFSESIECIALSPGHSHAFLGTRSGRVLAYDLECLTLSPYTVPNTWEPYQESSLAGPSRISRHQSLLMDILPHPRDLNVALLVYSGGLVYYNLSERIALKHYELMLSPGAPGGSGYTDPELLSPRSPAVTAAAFHPSGLMFAVGYSDGCVAFWAVEDEDKPLLVRTLDDLDVNIPDGDKLAAILEGTGHSNQSQKKTIDLREPIFKLAWSSLDSSHTYGGSTSLSILGGLRAQQDQGFSVFLLSPLVSPDLSLNPEMRPRLHPLLREALVQSVKEKRTYFYITPRPLQDFLLIPRESPYWGATSDPIAVLLLSGDESEDRSVTAHEFPPPSFSISPSSSASPQLESGDVGSLDNTLASTLNEMQAEQGPAKLPLPNAFYAGEDAIVDGDIIHVDSVERLLPKEPEILVCPIEGGEAFLDIDDIPRMKFAKYYPSRILITHHRDLTIRFHNISPQVFLNLSASQSLNAPYPDPLRHLTISLQPILTSSVFTKHGLSPPAEDLQIRSVQLTPRSFECVVTLRSGHVLVFVLGTPDRGVMMNYGDDDLIVPLTHLVDHQSQAFQPVLLVENAFGPVAGVDICDIGLLALSYSNGAVVVVDIRESRLILREEPQVKSPSHLHLSFHSRKDETPKCLKWLYCGYEEEQALRPRLAAITPSGVAKIYSFVPQPNTYGDVSYKFDSRLHTVEGLSDHSFPRACWILDARTGVPSRLPATRRATRDGVDTGASLSALGHDSSGQKGEPQRFWVTAGSKGAKCFVDIDGKRRKVASVEWGKRDVSVDCAEVVVKDGASVLLAITSVGEAIAYSLPSLELLHTLHFPVTPTSIVSVDNAGFVVLWNFTPKADMVSEIAIYSLFHAHRLSSDGKGVKVMVDWNSGRKELPAPPSFVEFGNRGAIAQAGQKITELSSWLQGSGRYMTGAQIDALLGGPNRPQKIPKKADLNAPGSSAQAQTWAESARGLAGMGDLYGRMTNAMNERGEMLSDLEERFRSLETGSRDMISQAKRLAAEQTGKSWFGF